MDTSSQDQQQNQDLHGLKAEDPQVSGQPASEVSEKNEAIIEFSHFGFQYNAQAKPTLYDINLSIRKGEKVLIVGPSGCGKSTIVNCINGLIPFMYEGEMTGSLKIGGKETRDLSIAELSKIVGTVLQDSDAQFIGMTVLEDIAFALENECMEKEEMLGIVNKVADIVDVGHLMKNAPTEVSGGQKQRVSIAGIMVDNVDVMLFDEPLANLDPATGKKAMELIDDIQSRTKAAVVIVEHRLEDVLHRDVDRIVLMNDGHIIFDDTPDKLLSSNLLTQNGIREPLYITALKYSGVEITPDLKPHSIRTIQINDDAKTKVQNWYDETKHPHQDQKKETLLELRDIEFGYDSHREVLRGVNLTIHKGELLALVGRNGAGKTTLSKVICHFVKPSKGTMLFKGEDMSSLSIKETADRIGYVMQNPNQMISKVMIFDEVAMGLHSRGIPEEEIKERVEKVLKICGLYEFRNWPISALSYGQKKRVTIASILVLDPEMLILDEPTAGQDFRHYTDIMEFLRTLNQNGLTIMMITHDMHLMLEYAERSVVFCDGQVIADSSSAGVLTNPEIIEKASLKETSLYDLSLQCGIENTTSFVQNFIDYDREVSH